MALGPSFSAPSPLDYQDTVAKDDFPTVSIPEYLLATGSGTVTYGITGGTDLGTTVTLTDPLGTLTVNKATGSISFAPNAGAANALSAFGSADFPVTATDDNGTSSTTFSIFFAQIGTTETEGDDNLVGTSGNDVFASLAGSDTLDTGLGNDTLDGGIGADTLLGGGGNDTYYVDNTGDVVTESLAGAAGGTDTVFSKLASYTLGSNVENGRINTSATANLVGNSLANTLVGGAGKNVLTGGAGKDTLSGAAAADRFDFNTLAESGITAATRDTLSDFSHTQGDKIDLLTLDANSGLANNQAFTKITSSSVAFSATKSFTAAGQLYYDQAADVLYGNTDKDAAPEFSIKVLGVTSLLLSDFIL